MRPVFFPDQFITFKFKFTHLKVMIDNEKMHLFYNRIKKKTGIWEVNIYVYINFRVNKISHKKKWCSCRASLIAAAKLQWIKYIVYCTFKRTHTCTHTYTFDRMNGEQWKRFRKWVYKTKLCVDSHQTIIGHLHPHFLNTDQHRCHCRYKFLFVRDDSFISLCQANYTKTINHI